MTDFKALSLCSGYGGLDRAVADLFGKHDHFVKTVAFAEFDPTSKIQYPAEVFSYRHPLIPNLGDVKTIDWEAWKHVDIVTAGYPCQPFSHAGKQQGINDARHIWPHIYRGIRIIRPRFTILENVSGHLKRGFDTVLGDLAEGGFDVRWTSARASDIGAPHRRERVFIVATPASDARGEAGFVRR